MKKVMDQISKLCTPAMLYFVLSAVSFLAMLIQNCNDSSKYKVGTMEVDSPCHNGAFFVGKAIYILLWTYLLNFLCGKGLKTVSWALVLLPLLGMFLIIGLIFIALLSGKKQGEKKEGMNVDEGYGEQFEENPGVEGNMPPMPSEAPKEGFFEGLEDECDEGYEKNANGKCVQSEGFDLMEPFQEGEENECPEGQEIVDGQCQDVFGNREGFQEGAEEEEEEEEEDEGFETGNWPSVGQLL